MSNRNVVQHHGKLGAHGPEGGTLYTSLPMELARDGKLSYLARSVAMFIWSHDEKWQQSASAVADALGMKRDTVSKALAELQERGWLVREVHQTIGPSGKHRTVREVWHLQMSNRPFSAERIRELSTPEGARDTGTSPLPDVPATRARITGTCLPHGHGGARHTGTLGAHQTGTIEVEGGVHLDVHSSSARAHPGEDPEGGPLASAGRYTGAKEAPGDRPESETESVSSSDLAVGADTSVSVRDHVVAVETTERLSRLAYPKGSPEVDWGLGPMPTASAADPRSPDPFAGPGPEFDAGGYVPTYERLESAAFDALPTP